MSNYNSSFPVAKLYKKTSARGNTYFVGRWGGARVTLLLSNETAEDGGEVWNLMLGEAPAKREGQNGAQRSNSANERQSEPEAQRPENGKQGASVAQRDWQRPADRLNDPIPFGPEFR